MTSEKKPDLDEGMLLGLVRDGQAIQIFGDEDTAAEFITIVKMYDPQDDLIYVIYPHQTLAGKFIVKIFSPPGHFLDDGASAQEPKPAQQRIIEKIRQRKAA